VYPSYFGLKECPFNLTPDPRYLYLSPYHKEALDHLLYGIQERKGFIRMIGGIGTGKTTICRSLLGHLDASTRSALLFNAFISDIELLETINQEFGIKMDAGTKSKKDYIDALNQFLLETYRSGGNAVLLIDEAQNLSHSVLEQIRMLSNLEAEKEKLIQIVLVGQTELNDILASPSLKQLNERIMVRYDLKPLDSKDIKGYVEHRLIVAGGRGNLELTRGFFKKIYAYSRGNPRRINAVCDRALLIAYAQEKHTLTKSIAGRAIQELYGGTSGEKPVIAWTWKRYASFTLLLLILIMVAGFAGLSYKESLLGPFLNELKGNVAPPVQTFSRQEKTLKPEKEQPQSPTEGNEKQPPTTPAEEDPEKKIVSPIEQEVEQTNSRKPENVKDVALFLDEKTSVVGLFDLYNGAGSVTNQKTEQTPKSLVTFDLAPEYFVMLKKPFRVQRFSPSNGSTATPLYLLIRQVTEGGAVAIDAGGREWLLARDFIMRHWGGKVSWIYLHKEKKESLEKGMDVPEVLQIQKILQDIGYLVEPTGFYNASTFSAVRAFQRDFGIPADGIVGLRTRALLFQMSQ
jgi:general secretion pathway protein A